jgi:Ca-activated chloride channel family protein
MMFSRIWRYALLSAGILAGAAILANESSAAGLLSPSDGTTPPLVIQDQAVRVTVEDGYAITAVEQVFRNPHGKDFEAIYSFPVPKKAAVSGFTYWIDGKPVTGEVLAKKKAREVYE